MPRFAANLTLLFNELPFIERFAAARDAGFKGVEYLFPYAWSAEELSDALACHQLTQVLFNLPPGNWDEGERGIACLPDRVGEFQAGVETAIRYAQALDCHQLNCLAGLKPPEIPREKALETLVNNLRWAADRLAQEGITILLEAINSKVDMPGFLVDRSALAMKILAQVARPNIKFQYDVYHMQIMEGDLLRTLRRLGSSVGHIQVADNPGRHEPGTGEINFPVLFQALDAMGYGGWIGAEYHPVGQTQASLGWLEAARDSI